MIHYRNLLPHQAIAFLLSTSAVDRVSGLAVEALSQSGRWCGILFNEVFLLAAEMINSQALYPDDERLRAPLCQERMSSNASLSGLR